VRVDRSQALAALWAFAEAIVFFVVPDVLLSRLALRSRRSGFIACLSALAGALVGGAAMWIWGALDPESARRMIASLPAIDSALIARVHEQVADRGLVALFLGPLRGVPYKIYAVETASLGHSLAVFLLVSAPARLIRFTLVTALIAGAAAIVRRLREGTTLRTLELVHLVCWVVFYTWYFVVMPG